MQLLTRNRDLGRTVAVPDRSSEPAPAAGVRTVVAAALGPLIAGYAAVAAVLGLVTAIASVATFTVSGVLQAAGPGWLAAYQVPLTISGRPLGVLPLTATFAMCLLVACSAARAARRLDCREPRQMVNLVGSMAGAHALLGVVIAVLPGDTVVSAEPLAAFLIPGLIAAVSATLGLARGCGLVRAAGERLDPAAVRGLRAGVLGMAGLLAAGALVVTLSLVLSMPTVGRLFGASAPGFGSGAGMLLLSLGYFPNAIVCALSFAAGPGFSLGSVSVGPFSFSGGVVPGVPLLAGIPEHRALWWGVLMLLPAAVGALVGWTVRDSDANLLARLRTVAIAGGLAGLCCVPLSSLAGGRLGAGPFDPVAVPVGLLSLAAFCWIAVPGGLVAWLAGPPPAPATTDTHPEDSAGDSPGDVADDTPDSAPDDLPDDLSDDAESETASDAESEAASDAGDGEEAADESSEPAESEEPDIPLSENTAEEPEDDQTSPGAETPEQPS
ncbi:DUF6350 family protein [Amycolatopsis taiwanensis]|uniref:cell division protein PerM n=1 Tax=Amycolatopsis taiwanensis TaxID=342230 RepID=UPI000694F6B0|nr:DUF6350 family protein [Amycolatopsis taiwanensis]